VQAFAAGAALCSTSLGTTFTILSTSGLDKSRLGVIMSSAAMLDDVAGLVMVQVISNLGSSAGSFSATTVVRPVFVSIAFAVVVPLLCRFVIQPLTKYSLAKMSSKGAIAGHLSTPPAAFVTHTLLLIALVTGSSYAGTSNLFAAYIAGTIVSWWDSLVTGLLEPKSEKKVQPHKSSPSAPSPGQASKQSPVHETPTDKTPTLQDSHSALSGSLIYDQFYAPAVGLILKPFFFVGTLRYLSLTLRLTTILTGFYRFRNPRHKDVLWPHRLARASLHDPDDHGQTLHRPSSRALRHEPVPLP